MKVIKNINNNVSLCMDNKGRECIAFGKGIGFIKPPYEVPLDQIECTFYSKNNLDYEGIRNVSEEVLRLAIRMVDHVESHLQITLMSSTALALADHIHFAIQRMNEHIDLKLSLKEDLKLLYRREFEEANRALDLIEEELGVRLDDREAATIALHFINNRVGEDSNNEELNKKVMETCVQIIEKGYHMSIHKESYNYSRFVTHVDFLVRRTTQNNQITSINASMYNTLKKEYPEAYECAKKISTLFKRTMDKELSDEEQMYLILHINRLCSREQVHK